MEVNAWGGGGGLGDWGSGAAGGCLVFVVPLLSKVALIRAGLTARTYIHFAEIGRNWHTSAGLRSRPFGWGMGLSWQWSVGFSGH